MILLIDNYDSFTYNLYQYMGIFEKDIKVVRNDKVTIEEIEQLNPDRIVLSPGPKSPKEAGICIDVVKHFYQKTILKVKQLFRLSPMVAAVNIQLQKIWVKWQKGQKFYHLLLFMKKETLKQTKKLITG